MHRAFLSFLFFSVLTLPCFAQSPVITTNELALNGFDVVTYYEEETPRMGLPENQMRYQNEIWLFSSTENLMKFQQNPERYLPEYKGWCAYAISEGRLTPSNPTLYSIDNGKLYLMCNDVALKKWKFSPKMRIHKANQNWHRMTGQ